MGGPGRAPRPESGYGRCRPHRRRRRAGSRCRETLRFYIDPVTGEPHIYRHDVREEEVEEVLRYPGDDFPGRNNSRIALGQTEAGRHLQVVYVPDPEGYAVFVVTAYDLKGKALMAFRRRKRRKRP
ncbi:MAG TPA: hypothetical protein DD490_05720 [Acidobacteria bacterium]|nr:hypothetical protein [Acidobacteriota bacterium]